MWPTYLNTIYQISQALVIILGGFFTFYFAVTNSKRTAKKNLDETSDKLLGILKDTVEQQGLQIESLQKNHKDNEEKIATLTSENRLIKDILQGRDEKSEHMYEWVKQTNENMTRLFEHMENHTQNIEDILTKIIKTN